MRTPKPLQLKLRSSRYFSGYLLLVHGLAAWALLAVLPNFWGLAGLFGVVCCGCYYWRRYVRFSDPRAVSELKFSDNRWQVLRSGAQNYEGLEWRAATVLPYLVVLQFYEISGRGLNVAVLADQLDPQCFRQLRVVAGFAGLPRRQWFNFR